MRWKTWIVHRLDSRMSFEKLGHETGVVAVRAHAPWECADSAQQEPAVERRGYGAANLLEQSEPFHELVFHARDDGATEQVAVSAEILGGGVHHEIRPEPERKLEHRCRPRVVHDAARANCVRELGETLDVHD